MYIHLYKYRKEDLLLELANTVMEAERSQDLLSTTKEPRKPVVKDSNSSKEEL